MQAELPKTNGMMFFRWKEAKLVQNGIDQYFGPQLPDRHTIVKFGEKNAFFLQTK